MVILRRDDFLRPKKKSNGDQEKFNVNKESSTKESPKSPTKIGEIGRPKITSLKINL